MHDDRGDAPFCVLCGQRHPMMTACDAQRLAWVQTRRREIAGALPWQAATPIPEPKEAPDGR